LHWADPVCWQTQAELHHPANPKCYILNTESHGLTKLTSLRDGLDYETRRLGTKISKIPVTWFQLLSPKRSLSLQ
jgi:hypothetical protein